MKILFLADEESNQYWDFFKKEYFEGIDLIVSCGDLKSSYISFLATMLSIPVLYVHGNHDDHYLKDPPGGCTCIEDQVFVYEGIRFLGLGGSYRYKPGVNQYEEKQMVKRFNKLKRKIKKNGGIDILVTHAPAYGLNDDADLCHRGFDVFNTIIDTYHPKYFVHGHVHMNYGRKFPREDKVGETVVINAYQKYIVEV